MAARRGGGVDGRVWLLQGGAAYLVPGRALPGPREVAHPRRRRGTRMRVDVFVEDERVPRASFDPPGQLELDTSDLEDGPHVLRVRAAEGEGSAGNEEIPFVVRNGPGIAVVGLRKQEVVPGRAPILVNAYHSRLGEV